MMLKLMRGKFMNDFFLSFTLGLLCTFSLFALCFLTVIGAKAIYVQIIKALPKQPLPEPEVKEVKKKRPRTHPSIPKTIRSIEIDPNTVDRIYVKKS